MIARWKIPGIFIFVVLLVLSWAFYTQHVWEDYFITYRASKNLATGQGLTFTAGERVHSFTSPLGVLLPAVASLLTGNSSDTAVLWLFRLMGASALAGAVVILQRLVRRLALAGIVVVLMTAAVLTDAKILDFTINGMETPFLLLFLSWVLWVLFAEPTRPWLPLGLAWAGLQWTRPDAFIYIGGLAWGVLLFRPTVSSWRERLGWCRSFIGAGLITTVVYLPWVIWAWLYYGTPVPHTIIAKGLWLPKFSAGLVFTWLQAFPGKMISDHSIMAGTFMPGYSFNTGWPAVAIQTSFWLTLLAIVLWLVPRVRWEARVASFAAAVGQFYLHSFVGFPVPWYMPPVTLLALVALVLVWGQIWQATGSQENSRALFRLGRSVLAGGAGLLLLGAMAISLGSAYQLRWQQKIIEEGQRRRIGEWLRGQATNVHDTVFLEPLGYIGFYSKLKMLDFPGLCSPEMVAARRRSHSSSPPRCWPELIMDLQPDWLVLRYFEAEGIRQCDPELLDEYYDLARVFDVRPQVEAIPFLPGRGYLTGDAYFEVYRRRSSLPRGFSLRRIKESSLTQRDSWGQPAYDSGRQLQSHAPSQVKFNKPAEARWLSGGLGILEEAYANPSDSTDGAVFTINFVGTDGARRTLLERFMNPRDLEEDRGTWNFRVELPANKPGEIELDITPGPQNNNAYDWTYWSFLNLEIPQQFHR